LIGGIERRSVAESAPCRPGVTQVGIGRPDTVERQAPSD